jgi:hypothetical protein
MKENSKSLNRIYGDPQLIAVKTRIRFIHNKQQHMRLPFEELRVGDGVEERTEGNEGENGIFAKRMVTT